MNSVQAKARGAMNTTTSYVRSGANTVRTKVSGMSGGQLAGLFVIILVIILIIALIVSAIKKNMDNKSRQNPLLIGAPLNMYTSLLGTKYIAKFPNSQIPTSDEGLVFTYSLWFYIADWNYKFGAWKALLVKGSGNSRAPGLWFYPKTNSLHARINTYADPNEGCDIKNIPLQKWVHLVYVLNNRTVDIYINGKLERSCVLRGVPKMNNGDLTIGQDDGAGPGFYGQIAKLQYFSSALKPDDVLSIYSQGPLMSPKYRVQFFQGGSFVQTQQQTGDFNTPTNTSTTSN